MTDSNTHSTVVFVPYGPDNPYQDELAKGLEAQGVKVVKEEYLAKLFRFYLFPRFLPDVLHLHWLPMVGLRPLNFIRSLLYIFRLFVFRMCGVKLVWTVHNLIPHEAKHPLADVLFRRIVGKVSNAVIAHGETARQELLSKLGVPLTKTVVILHGNYIGVYENNIDKSEARKRLNVVDSSLVMLFLGNLRPYKGVLEFVRTFRGLELESSDVRLIIAGRPLDEKLSRELICAIGNCGSIDYRPGFVPSDMVQFYMNAADLIVMPYKKVLSSGLAVLAMSFGKPCVAPAIGCLRDILTSDGSFLYSVDDPNGLRTALLNAVEKRQQLSDMGACNFERAKAWSWSPVAEKTLNVYRSCCGVRVC